MTALGQRSGPGQQVSCGPALSIIASRATPDRRTSSPGGSRSTAAASPAGIPELQKSLGNESPKTTAVYVELARREMDRQVQENALERQVMRSISAQRASVTKPRHVSRRPSDLLKH
jgi:hypothetical protein